MALKDLDNTEVDLLSIFATVNGNLDDLTTEIKSYIGREIGASASEVESKILAGDNAIKDLIGVNLEKFKALQLMLDQLDGTEDGQFDPSVVLTGLAEKINDVHGRTVVNKSAIASLGTLINKEISDRIKQGTTLAAAIKSAKDTAASLISAIQTSLVSIENRVSALEVKSDATVSSINTFAKGMQSLAKELLNSTFKFTPPMQTNNANAL